MKSAQIIRRLSFSEWGGTECVVWNSAKMLLQLGDETEILATKALEAQAFEQREGLDIHRFGYCYPYFPMGAEKMRALDKKGGNPYVPELAGYLRSHRFDLLHCHAMGRIAATVRREAERARIPYVMSFHGGCFDIPEAELKEMLQPLRHTLRYGALLDRLCHLRCDALRDAAGLLCVGRNELAPVRERYPDKLVEYLPNGVDVERFAAPARVDFRAAHQIPSGARMILSVSRLDYQKNQLSLVELLARLRCDAPEETYHLVLIGPPTAQWYYQKLLARIETLQLQNSVTVIPGLPPDSPELPAAYQAADVFILPSLHEPFGIVILEAWSAGTPVIASPVGGINFLIRDGENGCLCDPADLEKLSSLTRRFCSSASSAEREKIVSAARQEAEREYSWTNIARRLRNFYSRAAEAYRSGHRNSVIAGRSK